ncbi:MAG: transporter associated domain-containing protein, partial [Actinomycetota bacterium]
ASVGDVNDLLDIRIPDDDWDTIAGFVFNMLEHVPVPGEYVDHDGWRFAAETVEGRRIAVVRVSARPPSD